MSPLEGMTTGAIAVASALAGVFFLRFWRNTRDRFFLYFVAGFWLEALSRVVSGLFFHTREDEPILYGVRLVAYGLILAAIWQKNRPRGPQRPKR